MFVVPLRPIDAASLAQIGKSSVPDGAAAVKAPKTCRIWRRRPITARTVDVS